MSPVNCEKKLKQSAYKSIVERQFYIGQIRAKRKTTSSCRFNLKPLRNTFIYSEPNRYCFFSFRKGIGVFQPFTGLSDLRKFDRDIGPFSLCLAGISLVRLSGFLVRSYVFCSFIRCFSSFVLRPFIQLHRLYVQPLRSSIAFNLELSFM